MAEESRFAEVYGVRTADVARLNVGGYL